MTAARLLPLLLMIALDAVPLDARADDAACQAVLQSVIKQAAVPVHQKITIESAAAPGKPPTGGVSDSQIWIATGSGMPLRQATTVTEQGAVRMKHEVRFDYANVA